MAKMIHVSDESRREIIEAYKEALADLKGSSNMDCPFNEGLPCQYRREPLKGPAIQAIKLRISLIKEQIALEASLGASTIMEELQGVKLELEIARDKNAALEAENKKLKTAALASVGA